jgi:hypothetical protein
MLAKLKTKTKNVVLEIKLKNYLKIGSVLLFILSFAFNIQLFAQTVTITELEIIDQNTSSSISSSISSSQSTSINSQSSSSQSINSSSSQPITPQAPPGVSSLPFRFNSANIFVNGPLSMVLGPALNELSNPIINAPCEIWILPPRANIYVVLYGVTNNQGICSYTTSQSVFSQNLSVAQVFQNQPNATGIVSNSFYIQPSLGQSVLGGNINFASINGQIGNGRAFGLVQYNSVLATSNQENYTINGGIIDIGFEYPGLGGGGGNGFGGFVGQGGSGFFNTTDGLNNESVLANIFNLLARSGGFSLPLSLLAVFLIIILYLLSRKKE